MTSRGRLRFVLGLLLLPVLLVAAIFGLMLAAHDPLHSAFDANDATAAEVYQARHVIADYYAAQRRLPADVPALLAAHSPRITDGRGNPFHVTVQADGLTVEIASLGADANKGGTGPNRDIGGVFRADILAGEKIEDVGPWIKDPLDDVTPWKF